MTDFSILLTLFVIAASLGALIAIKRRMNSSSVSETEEYMHPGESQMKLPQGIGCFVVHLSDLARTAGAARELSVLKGGDPVWLERCGNDDSGIERVKVYSGGFMLGQVLLEEAALCNRLINDGRVSATFVDNAGPEALSVKVFYRLPRQAENYKVTYSINGRQAIFIQN